MIFWWFFRPQEKKTNTFTSLNNNTQNSLNTQKSTVAKPQKEEESEADKYYQPCEKKYEKTNYIFLPNGKIITQKVLYSENSLPYVYTDNDQLEEYYQRDANGNEENNEIDEDLEEQDEYEDQEEEGEYENENEHQNQQQLQQHANDEDNGEEEENKIADEQGNRVQVPQVQNYNIRLNQQQQFQQPIQQPIQQMQFLQQQIQQQHHQQIQQPQMPLQQFPPANQSDLEETDTYTCNSQIDSSFD